jgi:hypothetical protein
MKTRTQIKKEIIELNFSLLNTIDDSKKTKEIRNKINELLKVLTLVIS